MSKKTRCRESAAEKKQEKLERAAFEAKKQKVRKVTAIVTAALILAFVLTMVVGYTAYNIRMNRGEYLRREIAAATSDIEVDGAMMNYYFNDICNTFISYYGSYVAYYGLDPTMPLRSQYIDSTESWFDYFMSGAKTTVTNILALNEAARAAGMSLSEAELAAIRARADATDTGLYGRGVTANDIYNAKRLEALAYGHQFAKQAEFVPTDAEINAYYQENPKSFQQVDYLAFPLYYTEAGMNELEVREWTEKLADAKSEEAFRNVCSQILLIEDPDITEAEITSAMENLPVTGALWAEGNEVSEWAFSAKKGDTLIIPDTDNTTYTVYYLTAEAYRDESSTVNVRQILFTDSACGSREKALKEAQTVLADWQASGASPESFALLALEKSEDSGSYYNGGRYEHVVEGQMVESFSDWCFDEARKPGDTGIVETDYGVHIMYFEKESLPSWKASVADQIVAGKISEYLTESTAAYPVVFDEIVLDMIPD